MARGDGTNSTEISRMVRTNGDRFAREIVDAELRRFYYDTAQVANR